MSADLEEKEPINSAEDFENLVSQGREDYDNCIFLFPALNKDLLIKKLTDKNFSFQGAIFSEDVRFYKTDLEEKIIFIAMTFKKALTFYKVTFKDNLEIRDCIFNDLEILSSPVKKLYFLNNIFAGKFKISQGDLQQADALRHGKEVEKIKIEELAFINNTVETGALVRFGYLDVDYFHFQNMRNPVDSEINIGECDFNKFILRNLRNNGKFRLYRINTKKKKGENEEFILTDSSLGDSEFQNVNLGCYQKIFITDNLLSGLKYTEVQWPGELETDPENSDQKKREIYRNLKNVALENNDGPQAVEFYAKEMDAYSRTLSETAGKGIDKFILWVNRWTNKFGLNWILPIAWILGLGVILYTFLLLSCSCICDPDIVGKFFVFLNPTHETGFVCEGHWSNFTYLIDFTFRILEATLIYQTIVAFRKFTRKL